MIGTTVGQNLLVVAADRTYVNQARQTINGARINGGWTDDIMLLYRDIPDEELRWFIDNDVIVRMPEDRCSEAVWRSRQRSPRVYPTAVNMRLDLFKPEYRRWDKIVHIDADTIVLGPLHSLLDGEGFSAVPDYGSTLASHFTAPERFHEIFDGKFHPKEPAFNAGVFVFSPSQINSDCYDTLWKLFDQYFEHCNFAEQSILNLYFYKNWDPLPWKMNMFFHHMPKKIKTTGTGCTVIHFPMTLQSSRPWEPGNPFFPVWQSIWAGDNSLSVSQSDSYNNVEPHKSVYRHIRRVLRVRRLYCLVRQNRFFSAALLPPLRGVRETYKKIFFR